MIKTDTEKLTVEMEGNLADYMMDFVLIVEGIKAIIKIPEQQLMISY